MSLAVVDGHIPIGTAILAGTPSGTIFKGVDSSAMALGAFDWLFGRWDRPVTDWVVERQIAAGIERGDFLQPGDRVQIHVEALGELDDRVTQ